MIPFRTTGHSSGDSTVPDAIASALVDPGYGVFPDVLSPAFLEGCGEWLDAKIAAGELVRARVGQGAGVDRSPEIRSDEIHWLEADDPAMSVVAWLAEMDGLREHLRRTLFLPLESYEGHIARYPVGGFYKPHLDQHRDSATRQVTVLFYHNPGWAPCDGGELRLYTDPSLGIDGPWIDIAPKSGTLIAFRSAEFWHEVLLSHQPRVSLTGWLRGREENPLQL